MPRYGLFGLRKINQESVNKRHENIINVVHYKHLRITMLAHVVEMYGLVKCGQTNFYMGFIGSDVS
jgi:hypothetical protein